MTLPRRSVLALAALGVFAACRRSLAVAPMPSGGGPVPGPETDPSTGCLSDCGGVAAEPVPLSSRNDTALSRAKAGPGTLAGLKVAIDVGHSRTGSDRGAFGNGISEHEINLAEATVVAQQLRSRGAAVSLFHYPETTELDERGRNAAGHDIFISVHHNAFFSGAAQGTEVLVGTVGQNPDDRVLALAINAAIVRELWGPQAGERDRGAKAMSLGVLRNAPASVQAKCLTEAFFITADGLTASRAYMMAEKAGRAIASAVESFWVQQRARGQANQSLALAEQDGGFEVWPEASDDMGLYQGH